MTKTYARIEAGTVAELLRSEAHPATLFHPALRWLETKDPAVTVGWVENETGLAPPKRLSASVPAAAGLPTLADLNARVIQIEAQVAALTRR